MSIPGLTISSFYSRTASKVHSESISAGKHLTSDAESTVPIVSTDKQSVIYVTNKPQSTIFPHFDRSESSLISHGQPPMIGKPETYESTKFKSKISARSRSKSNITTVRKSGVKRRIGFSIQTSVTKKRCYAPVAVTVPSCLNQQIYNSENIRSNVEDIFRRSIPNNVAHSIVELVRETHNEIDKCSSKDSIHNSLNEIVVVEPIDQSLNQTIIKDPISDSVRQTLITDSVSESLNRIVDFVPFYNKVAKGDCNNADSNEIVSITAVNSVMDTNISPTPMFSIFNQNEDHSRMTSKVESRSPRTLKQSLMRQRHPKENVAEKEQMILDFGQTPLGTVQCASCGMTYNPGQPSDELTHDKYHKNLFSSLKFTGWAKERVVQDMFDGGSILVVMPEDKAAMKRVNLVKSIVDKDLGFVLDEKINIYSKIFLYVMDKRIIGFCAALPIQQGYRMLSDVSGAPTLTGASPDDAPTSTGASPGDAPTSTGVASCDTSASTGVSPNGAPTSTGVSPRCCSTVPERARCGINRIWVVSNERRKGIASRLLDAVRAHFLMGYHMRLSEIAFSDPTPDGIKLASKYCGSPCFLVYKTAF